MKIRLQLITLAASLLLFNAAKAQDDSTHYDLSRVRVNKAFTQNTTIKGSDLEKYQASDLSEAINVWLYGTYTQSASIIYVVDGTIINDVNAYSIFDIEEVTLVQTAMAQTSGAAPGQQMVLVTTRRHRKGKQEIEFNGSSSLANLRSTAMQPGALSTASTPGAKSTTDTYDQYYLAGYKNFKSADIGLTATYQHDAFPVLQESSFTVFEPSNFTRYKLLAYVDANLWKGSTLSFSTNYVPQANDYSYTADVTTPSDPNTINNTFNKDHSSQHMAASNFTIKSHIAGQLANTFSFGYNHYNYLEADSANNFYSANGMSSNTIFLTRATDNAHNVLIRDNLHYDGKLGNFNFEPALNFTYRNFSDSLNYSITSTYNAGTSTAMTYPPTVTGRNPHYSVYLLTPSIDFYYQDILNVQGGVTEMLNQGKAASSSQASHTFPFFTFAFDAAKFLGLSYKLSFHFSYARQSELLADDYETLLGSTFLVLNPSQVTYSQTVYNTRPNKLQVDDISTHTAPGISVLNPNLQTFNPNNVNPFEHYNKVSTGVDFGVTKNFSITYNVDFKNSTSYVEENAGAFTNGLEFPVLVSVGTSIVTNRFTLVYNYHSSKFTWNALLNGTETELRALGTDTAATNRNNDYLNKGHRWSGGFTNRFVYKYYFMGIDFLYQAGEAPYTLIHALAAAPDYIPPTNKNSFAVQNFYIGARLNIRYLKDAEIYANSRNLVQNNGGDITDGRRLYGLGFKTSF